MLLETSEWILQTRLELGGKVYFSTLGFIVKEQLGFC